MRHLKKLFGLVLTAIMAFSVATTAYAAQGVNGNNGSITINDAVPGHTYKAYQVLVLESYNTDNKAYAYKANTAWETWLKGEGAEYVSIDAQGYVTWKQGADAAAFAKAAIAYAEDNKDNITATATQTAPAAAGGQQYSTVSFTGLNLGYYVVNTTLGTLCSLDTTIPDATMHEKNEVPTTDKEVKEGANWGGESTAAIGDTVEFRTTIAVKPGALDYVLHDVMDDGLTLNADSIDIAGLTKGADASSGDYHVVAPGTDGCTFDVVFHQAYLDTIASEKNIVVTYSAVLNENAKIFDTANVNKTRLEYGNTATPEYTPWDETKTYSFMVDIVKTDDANRVLDGAEFKLYDAKTGGNEIAVVKVDEGHYRFAKNGETGVVITTKDGQVQIDGFDANTTYWLEETKAPDGYNKLAERVEIAIKKSNLEATVDNGAWTDGGVHVINKTGNLLPTTGGMGTTMFYVVGGALVAGAAVAFVVRKRANNA